MAYNDHILALVEYQVRRAAVRMTAMGVVAARVSPTRVLVTLDGDGSPSEVKVSTSVRCYPGDSVGLLRFGSDWAVVLTFGQSYWADVFARGEGAGESTASTTPVNWVVAHSIAKRDSDTAVHAAFEGTMHTGTANTEVGVSVLYTNTDTGVSYGPDLTASLFMVEAFSHKGFAGTSRRTGLPAGPYTVQWQWQRLAGAGTILFSSNDTYSVRVAETAPST